jgi:hypothetical protein
MNTRLALCVAAVTALAGCALPGKRERIELLNPRPIHTSADSNSNAARAGEIPVESYYKALELARTRYTETTAQRMDSAAIQNYVDEGIGLVDAYCLRWFRRLDDVQRQVNIEGGDWNIIRQLGTALLGIGSASSNWVALYGAGNTAYEGIRQNLSESILAGPTAKKIKGRVFALLQQSASELRQEAQLLPFPQAYSRLERHAEVCTFATVRELLDSSLAQTQSEINVETGELRSSPRELVTLTEPQLAERTAATRKILALLQSGDLEQTREMLKILGLAQSPQANIDEARTSLQANFRKAVRDPGVAAQVVAAP